jgi:hypothetical protein
MSTREDQIWRRPGHQRCRACQAKLDGSLGSGRPAAGDVSLCVYCGTLSIFTEDDLRAPTTDELVGLMADPEVRSAITAVALASGNAHEAAKIMRATPEESSEDLREQEARLDSQWQACGVCSFPLERRGEQWLHVRDLSTTVADHIAVPVPMSAIPARTRCDICDREPAAYEVNADSFKLPATDSRSVGAWALCVLCGPAMNTAIRRHSPQPLVTRHLEERRARGDHPLAAETRRWLVETYDRLLVHLTGGVLPMSRTGEQ